MTIEHGPQGRPEVNPIVLEDPLREQRKITDRITRNLEILGTRLEIRVFGAFHTGIIGKDIQEIITQSDIITTELPSEVVRQSRDGIKGKALSVNPFWADVLDQANAEHKKAVGVTTNRAVVNGLRGLNDRWRKDEKPFVGGPDLIISTRVQGEEIRRLINEAEVAPSLPGQPFLATVHGKIDMSQQPDSSENFPYHDVVDGKDGRIYIHYFRPFSEEGGKILIVSGDWSSPMEFAYSQFDQLSQGYEGIFPEIDHLVNFGVQHLMRLRGDRTQVNGILKEIDKEVKKRIKINDSAPLRVTHIGGAAHDRNLLAIFNDLFKEGGAVDVLEQFDSRIVPMPIDPLTFFSSTVPVREGLLSTQIFHDQILINMPRALSALRAGIGKGKEELYAVGKRKELVDQYSSIIKSQGVYQDIHIEVAEYMLSLLPTHLFSSSKFLMDEDFLMQLAQLTISYLPEKTAEIMKAMVAIKESSTNFPPIIEDEFKASSKS